MALFFVKICEERDYIHLKNHCATAQFCSACYSFCLVTEMVAKNESSKVWMITFSKQSPHPITRAYKTSPTELFEQLCLFRRFIRGHKMNFKSFDEDDQIY